MKRKLLIIILLLVCALCCTFALTACGGDNDSSHNDGTVKVTYISLNEYSIELVIGEEQTLTATILPESATDKTLIWSSSAPEVATVDNNGKITAIGVGNTNIKVSCNNDRNATCNVMVYATGELEFKEISDIGYSVKGIGTVKARNVDVPSEYNGKPVLGIGNEAFRNCTSLTSITIPDSVTSIGNGAFYGCTSLTSITIPNGLTRIDDNMFYSCRALTNITVPDSVTSIGDSAFDGCSGLTSIIIPDSVTSIDVHDTFFWGASGAFSRCTNLKNVYIGKGLKNICIDTFYACDNLINISIAQNNPKYQSIGNCIIEKESKELIIGCKNSIIPSDGSVSSIGAYAFRSVNITNITIPDTIVDIGSFAFSYSSLTSINVANGNPKYHSAGNCLIETASKTLIVGCQNSVIPADGSVTKIGNNAFMLPLYQDNDKKYISVPDSITHIDYNAFYGCKYTEYNNALYLGNENNPYLALIKCNDTTITSCNVNNNCKIIANGAFVDCQNLKDINIADSVISIGDGAFSNCSNLTNITMGNGVTYIGDSVFQSCDNLRFNTSHNGLYLGNKTNSYLVLVKTQQETPTFSINYKCKVIAPEVFSHYGFRSITIPESVISINVGSFGVFYNSLTLTAITVAKNNPKYHSAGNCLIETASKTLIAGCQNSVIPTDGSVTSIGNNAFSYCTGLTSITIPDSVTSIGNNAFSYCTGLTSITIPDSVTSIGNGAFYGCTGLTNITIPDSITSINGYAFSGCSSLTSITIPDGVTSIGVSAFEDCTGLTSITFNGTIAQWNAISKGSDWNSNTGNYTIHCTDGDIAKS